MIVRIAEDALLLRLLLDAANRIVFGGRHCWRWLNAPGPTSEQ